MAGITCRTTSEHQSSPCACNVLPTTPVCQIRGVLPKIQGHIRRGQGPPHVLPSGESRYRVNSLSLLILLKRVLRSSVTQTGRIVAEVSVLRPCGGPVHVSFRSAQPTRHSREPHRLADRRAGPSRRGSRTRRRRHVLFAMGGGKARPHDSLRAISRAKYVNPCEYLPCHLSRSP